MLIVDDTPPNVVLQPAVTVQIDRFRRGILSPITLYSGTSDNCGVDTLRYYVEGSSTNRQFSCHDVLTPPKILATSVTDGFNPVPGNVTVTVRDDSNNCGCHVDIRRPTISCPSSAVIVEEFTGHLVLTGSLLSVTVEDECDTQPDLTLSPPVLDCSHEDLGGLVSVLATATDDSNLSDSCVVEIDLRVKDRDEDGYDTSTCGEEADCDDTDKLINPGQQWYLDMDGDGYGVLPAFAHCGQPVDQNGASWTSQNGDCNDNDIRLNPSTEWFTDNDQDAFGAGVPIVQCERPGNSVLEGGDCDDTSGDVSPGILEVCDDNIDNNCDGVSIL